MTYDPKMKVGHSVDSERDCLDHCWKIFDLNQTSDEQKSKAALLWVVLRWALLELVDAVIDAGDAIAPGKGSLEQVIAGSIADGHNPIAEQRDEVISKLSLGIERWSDQAMPRGDDGLDTSEPGCHSCLKCRRRIMAVNDVRPGLTEDPEKAQCCAGNRTLAYDVDMEAFCAKHFKKRSQTGVNANGDVMSFCALHTAELHDKYLRTSHLKTVDNVDDFHWLGEVFTAG